MNKHICFIEPVLANSDMLKVTNFFGDYIHMQGNTFLDSFFSDIILIITIQKFLPKVHKKCKL